MLAGSTNLFLDVRPTSDVNCNGVGQCGRAGAVNSAQAPTASTIRESVYAIQIAHLKRPIGSYAEVATKAPR